MKARFAFAPETFRLREDLNGDKIISRRNRNRRIGEFFKELELTEGRCTGIPKMRAAMEKNGSPPPRFSTDEGRTHFLVELPVHPEMPGLQVREWGHDKAHDEAHDEAHDLNQTEERIVNILAQGARSAHEIAIALHQKTVSGGIKHALNRLQNFGLIVLTIPDKPRSKNQKRQLTVKGQMLLASQRDPKAKS